MTRVTTGGVQEAPPGELLALPDHLSFSQITRLSPRYVLSCPRQWAYERLVGLPQTFGPAVACGAALDRAVTAFYERRLCGDTWSIAAAMGHDVIERYLRGYVDWPADRDIDTSVRMMTGAYTTFIEEYGIEHSAAAVQTPHEFAVLLANGSTRKVIGFSDWIEPDGVICDLKYSGRNHWDRDGLWDEDYLTKIRDQLTGYYMGRLSDERRGAPDKVAPVVPRGRVIVVVASLKRVTPVIKVKEFDLADRVVEVADTAREAVSIAEAPIHAPRPGAACQWCSYNDRCRVDSVRLAVPTVELTR